MRRENVLAMILLAGCRAAREADPGPGSDGGSCNLYSPFIAWPRTHDATFRKAADRAGVDLTPTRFLGSRGWLVHTPCEGQAGRRTAMAEAASAAMSEAATAANIPGFRCWVWYQVD